ncbi:MAG: phage tail tape measure protein [Pseudomonadota bacterium]
MDEIDGLEDALATAGDMTEAFEEELRRMQAAVADTSRDVAVFSKELSRGLKDAFDGIIFEGKSLSDVLGDVARSMANAAFSAAIRPVTNQLGGLIAQGVGGLLGQVTPFATGGVVNGPVAFPMRGGLGLMGEAGPEAILPLSRGRDGRLGVRAEGNSRPVNVVMNISTPDVSGFRRSNAQIAAEMTRALQRGERNT